MNILLLEDKKDISDNIKEYIEIKKSWKIDTAYTIKEAKEKYESNNYDLLVFDVMLPDGESYELANKIKKHFDTPIIFLTAKAELEDKLLGFQTWWDDYITKPFELQELIVRIETIAKRFWIWPLQIQGIHIDLENKTMKKDWKIIHLNKTEWLILQILLENRWKIIERANLLEYVWWEESIWDKKNDKKLDVYIANIRKKLNKDLIETVKWIWYKIN